ncbi:MAG: class I SAM-dependent methyltransferase [Methanosarcinaceae archaeon]|nr:class I SAM-dependent methyltransferase [Methanosarcinaceae archaeon]
MVKPRVVETDQGIQGEFNVQTYDSMLRRLRDKGWMETDQIISSGMVKGLALEVGPGPGYLGLECLKKTEGTLLKAVEISPDMIKIAEKNAKDYGFESRVEYVNTDAQNMPFDDSTFDAVFTNGSLHEWSEPQKIFNEIHRVLKPDGKYFISDLRRDMNPVVKWFMYVMAKPREIRPGLISSINAAYTVGEIESMLHQTNLKNATVKKTVMGLEITGEKIQWV